MRVMMPLVGAWTADVSVDSATNITGEVTLKIGEVLVLTGFVRRGGEYVQKGVYRLVGGYGGFNKTTPAKSYRAASVSVVLSDILQAGGEAISLASDKDVMDAVLTNWTTPEQKVGQALSSLVDSQADRNWRVLPDGSVWVGKESWPVIGVTGNILSQDVEYGRAVLDLPRPNLIPGMAMAGRRISDVQYDLSPDQGVRTTIWMGDE